MRKGAVEAGNVNKKLGGDKEKMKTKTKTLALLGIAIVLCSVFLVATLPAIAAEQTTQKVSATASIITTASEDDYVLDIYGNANEDDTIDMGDVVYTKLAIFGKKPKTELCDAKYDGRINVLDVIQTKLIILGKEKELTIIDLADKVVTVKKPVERLVVTWRGQLEMVRSLKIEKYKIVGVETLMQKDDYIIYFAEYQDKPSVSYRDTESILKLQPDVVFWPYGAFGAGRIEEYPTADVAYKAAGITVIHFGGGVGGKRVVEDVENLGYLFDKEAEAKEFTDFYKGVMNLIKEEVESIPEEDKPKVYHERGRYSITPEQYAHVVNAGGKNIFEGKRGAVDPEAVARLNPDIIVIQRKFGGIRTKDITECKELRDELMSRPELQKVTAVKTGKVYVLANYLSSGYGQSGCRSFVQDAYQAKWFNPTYFEELDPKAIHQEYLTRFQGLDIDLDKQGVFVYHPEEHPDGN